jgi:hypothetical protein
VDLSPWFVDHTTHNTGTTDADGTNAYIDTNTKGAAANGAAADAEANTDANTDTHFQDFHSKTDETDSSSDYSDQTPPACPIDKRNYDTMTLPSTHYIPTPEEEQEWQSHWVSIQGSISCKAD